MPRRTTSADTLPCRHPAQDIDSVKLLLRDLPAIIPANLQERGIDPQRWPTLLRAAVESLRGTASATTSHKHAFLSAILDYGVNAQVFAEWLFVGSGNRQDYRVTLMDGTLVAIEAKGCGDGNNLTIWDRPAWANEFIVWSQCPDSLIHQPGEGVWSAISTRLMPKMVAERAGVDAFVFHDARCGSDDRVCPKRFGVTGLRSTATEVPSQSGTTDWLPPPCIYLFPQTVPSRTNREPQLHSLGTCRFADSLLDVFGVPPDHRRAYVHDAALRVRNIEDGLQIQAEVTSRCWPDSEPRTQTSTWKLLRREY